MAEQVGYTDFYKNFGILLNLRMLAKEFGETEWAVKRKTMQECEARLLLLNHEAYYEHLYREQLKKIK